MKKVIYIWGMGNGLELVEKSINWDKVEFAGYIDTYKKNSDKMHHGGRVFSIDEISDEYDYIIIASMVAYPEIREQLIKSNIGKNKILCYFDMYDSVFSEKIDFINLTVRSIQLSEIYYQEKLTKMENMEYEIADKLRNQYYDFPIIKSSEEALDKIIKENCSVCRFGDGEFEIIFCRKRAAFQQTAEALGKRLKEILVNQNDKIITCIADNYGSLEKYTEEAAAAIRKYMTSTVRKEHMQVLDMKKEYYDTYVSRPYIIYRNHEYADKLFTLWKQVWNDRDIVVIEGELTRSGYKNDLFSGAKSVQRILCPAENAWEVYDEILEYVKEHVSMQKLLLIALGPTATVLAYDLAIYNYQAIDIGHLDNEYEWYLRKAEKRENIDYKYVNECGVRGRTAIPIMDEIYQRQIIKIIK